MLNTNRRDFLKYGLAGVGTLMIPRLSLGMLAGQDPHFYLHIQILGGADSTYLFDARPLEMTAGNMMQNYNAKEPMMITGSNGTTAFTPEYNNGLLAHFDRFSILNGVNMSMTFNGHDQNENQFITGSPFGGESFLPHLNMERSNHQRTPVDCIRNGDSFSSSVTTNGGGTVPLTPESTGPLIKLLNDLPLDNGDAELNVFMDARLKANATGSGRFSLTTQAMQTSVEQMPNLHQQMEKIPSPDQNTEGDAKFVQFLSGLFQQKIAQSAILVINSSDGKGFDTHDEGGAKEQPTFMAKLSERLALIFQAMKETPYDSTRSLLDVTTLSICSEFSRTMRQEGKPIDNTGTDHNPFTNTFILGGKGVKAGQIIGASDFATSTEVLSGAHQQLDPRSLSIMGRPFDFNTMMPRTDSPSAYKLTDYLNVDSVVNTIYENFGIPSTMFRLQGRNGPPAPILKGLLT